MWCKTCNIETNEQICPVCGSITIEDFPTEVYWCDYCAVPIIQVATQADKGYCPLCAKKMKYMSADLRPVFPEERFFISRKFDVLIFRRENFHNSPTFYSALLQCPRLFHRQGLWQAFLIKYHLLL